MKRILHTLLVAMISVSALFANQAEPTATPTQNPNSLQEQYKYLKADLEVINGFRMIKMYTMDRFWKVVMDSVQIQKVKIGESARAISTQQKEILALGASIKKLEGEKQLLEAKVDNLIVFGTAYSKGGFVTVISCVIAGLLVLSGFLFAASRVSYRTSRELRKLNEALYQEFDTYKRHAVEKEIKISRELQNHRNKLAELKMA